MQLSLTEPRSGIPFLLLVYNLLLWENVVSVPMCAMRNGRCFMSLGDMIETAGDLSHDISEQISKLLARFEKHYAGVPNHNDTSLISCHTSSLSNPESKEKAMHTPYAVLLNSVHTLLAAWEHPMDHIVSKITTLKNISVALISKANRIKQMNSGLQEGVNSLIDLILHGEEQNEKYPLWSGQASLQSNDEETRIRAFHGMISCLYNDFKKVDIYLNVLKCKNIQNSC
ncbi:prolactin-2C5-like [Acomys russatus]|uniref:prolactin-2C5-like n=1 Tax=Acomys russatus TaxID=60746 RepID=UPI0021E24C20|nr:prolactin-2C5-like [Acomys russatus]